MDAGKMRPINLWYSRGNPDGTNGCPDFPREGGGDERAELRRHADESCARTSSDEGMTVMNGPVYRYDEDATRQLAALAGVLGRPLVPAQQRRRRA